MARTWSPPSSPAVEMEEDMEAEDEQQQQQHEEEQVSAAATTTVAAGGGPTAALAPRRRRIIVAMTGATGAPLGIATLLALRRLGVETHLVTSRWADRTLRHETDYTPATARALADAAHANADLGSPLASGSFRVDGMVVVPCSMRALAAVARGLGGDLVARAADVVLKERRRLVLVARECPLSLVHLDNMAAASRAGAVVFPPVPAFYARPASVQDLVDHTVGRILDLFDLDAGNFDRWAGFPAR
ncbi:hypothetical protein CDD83_11096 [Cordyceps sp. RAO-2017]|nr:hypothetical protein CDD83_11096 [Cordyceps sp. RAO-2017]